MTEFTLVDRMETAEAPQTAPKIPHSKVAMAEHNSDWDWNIKDIFSDPKLSQLSWKDKTQKFLHTREIHWAVIILVLIDTLVVLILLFLDLAKERQKYETLEASEQCGGAGNDHEMKLLHQIEVASEVFHFLSLSILCVFVVEVTLKMLTGFRSFLHHKFEVLDAIVVYISFGLDVAYSIDSFSDILEELISLLILFRLWRVTRIVNGIVLALEDKFEKKYEAKKEEIEHLKDLLREYGVESPALEVDCTDHNSADGLTE